MKSWAAWVIFLVASVAWADDAAWTVVGGAGNFSKNKQIRMVSERVDIQLLPKRSHFRAEFIFRNEGPATTVTMAFPEENHGYPAKQAIQNFRSTVDGRPVRVIRKKLPESTSERSSEYVAAWLKQVPFGQGQTRRVVVDYWAINGDIGDYVQNFYVLKTGASWKEKIGKAVLVVDWSALRGKSEPRFTWDGGQKHPDKEVDTIRLDPRRVRIVLTNVEPTHDLHILWTNAFWNFEVNGEDVPGMGYVDRLQIVQGSGSDPLFDIHYLGYLFNDFQEEPPEDEEAAPSSMPIVVGRHFLTISPKRTLLVDGVPLKLRRPIKDGMIYLRDLVAALGGTFRYDPKLDRVFLKIE